MTKNFIKDREIELISTLNKTIGKIFPTDIFSLDDSIKNERVPKINITYSYTNSESMFYNTNQNNLNEYLRTYYYGIMISWDFKMFLPDKTYPIYTFSLESTPSPEFKSNGSDENSIYSYMIYSAFNNFAVAYENHFFN